MLEGACPPEAGAPEGYAGEAPPWKPPERAGLELLGGAEKPDPRGLVAGTLDDAGLDVVGPETAGVENPVEPLLVLNELPGLGEPL